MLMWALIPFLILILGVLILAGFQRGAYARARDLRRANAWTAAVLPAIIAWIAILFLRPVQPGLILLRRWEPEDIFPFSPALVFDQVSWSFGVMLLTLLLAGLLTDAIRGQDKRAPDLRTWLASHLTVSVNYLAILAGNLLTLLILWFLVDLLEFVIRLSSAESSNQSEKLVINLSLRLASITLAGSGLAIFGLTAWQDFLQPTQPAVFLILLAAAIRIGIFPFTPVNAFNGEEDGTGEPSEKKLFPASLNTLLALAPTASNLILMRRSADWLIEQTAPPVSYNLILILIGIAILTSAFKWLQIFSRPPLIQRSTGLSHWIAGIAGLALISTLLQNPAGSLSWGVILLGAGGIQSLFTHRPAALRWLSYLGALTLSSLPFTPSWVGVNVFREPIRNLQPDLQAIEGILYLLLLLAGQAVFLAGFIRSSQRQEILQLPERWIWLIYTVGLLALPGSLWGITWISNQTYPQPTWLESGLALGILIIAGFIIQRPQGWFRRPAGSSNHLAPVASTWTLDQAPVDTTIEPGIKRAQVSSVQYRLPGNWLSWMMRLSWQFYQALCRLAAGISRILEGPAGLLWALLLLTLLASLITQSGLGG